jgi:hypothetical protein
MPAFFVSGSYSGGPESLPLHNRPYRQIMGHPAHMKTAEIHANGKILPLRSSVTS